MIKIICELLEKPISFTEDKVNILEVSNKVIFNELLYRLNKSINRDDIQPGIVLLENDLEISFSKNVFMIYDLFNLDINNSKLLKIIYEEINNDFKFNYSDEVIISLQKELIETIKNTLMEYEYEFIHKEVLDIKDILKAIDLKLDINYYETPLENLFLLFDLISNFKIYKVLILVNAKCYFNNEELDEIYKMAKYKKINLLLIEYYNDNKKKRLESKVIVDEDFDEFYII